MIFYFLWLACANFDEIRQVAVVCPRFSMLHVVQSSVKALARVAAPLLVSHNLVVELVKRLHRELRGGSRNTSVEVFQSLIEKFLFGLFNNSVEFFKSQLFDFFGAILQKSVELFKCCVLAVFFLKTAVALQLAVELLNRLVEANTLNFVHSFFFEL